MNHSLFSLLASNITLQCTNVEQASFFLLCHVLLTASVLSTLHFECGLPWFVRSAISILLTIFDGGPVVGRVFLSCWAKRRLSMAWSLTQRDANRHNRFNRGITFDGGGRFMHRCQTTSGESCGVLKRQHCVKV